MKLRRIWALNGFLTIGMFFGQSLAEELPELWTAGSYTFSDELGGFTIRAVSGTGTLEDPFIITEELDSAMPTTLVIRTETIEQLNPTSRESGILFYLRVQTINGSGHPWIEFTFELQEYLGEPSDYADGLSFYQPGDKSSMIHSDIFATFSDDFEPYDRMVFRDGVVDPGSNASFEFPISDFTPERIFYLMQDPRIPSS
jgi:hypothetical protein